MKRNWLAAGRVALAVALLFWLSRSGAVDWAALRGLYDSWPVTLLAFLVLVAAIVATSWRLSILFSAHDLRMSLRDAIKLNLICNLFNLFLPVGGGDLARLYYAAADGRGKRTEIATILVVDRTMGLMAILIWPLLLVPLVSDLIATSDVLRSLVVVALVAVVLMTLLLAALLSRGIRASHLMMGIVTRLSLGDHPARVLNTLTGYRNHKRPLLGALAVSLVGQALSAIVIVLLFPATVGMLQWTRISFLAFLGFLANNIPLTPGGLGVGEAAFDSLFRLAGVEGGAAALLSWRILLVGLAPAGLVLYLRGQRFNMLSRTS